MKSVADGTAGTEHETDPHVTPLQDHVTRR
jgi:hypothetical protein